MRLTIFSIVLTGVSIAAGRSVAAPVDIWDATQGTVVTAASATDDFFKPHSANIANMFTPKVNVARPFEDDATNTLFADKEPQGFAHFVEWQTPAPVTLGSFDLFTVDDHPSFNRSFDRFTLYAWENGAFVQIFDSLTTHPYAYDDPAHVLLFSETLATPVTSDRFRAEFVQNGTMVNAYMGFTTYGPRILELAGYAAPAPPVGVPLPGALLLGVVGAGFVPVARRVTRR
jgi:hypothetical protein